MKDSGSKKIPENQLQYLTNSQSSDTVVNNYESSSTPTKIKGILNTSFSFSLHIIHDYCVLNLVLILICYASRFACRKITKLEK